SSQKASESRQAPMLRASFLAIMIALSRGTRRSGIGVRSLRSRRGYCESFSVPAPGAQTFDFPPGCPGLFTLLEAAFLPWLALRGRAVRGLGRAAHQGGG